MIKKFRLGKCRSQEKASPSDFRVSNQYILAKLTAVVEIKEDGIVAQAADKVHTQSSDGFYNFRFGKETVGD